MTREEMNKLYEFIGSTKSALEDMGHAITEIKTNHLFHLNRKIDRMIVSIIAGIVLMIVAKVLGC